MGRRYVWPYVEPEDDDDDEPEGIELSHEPEPDDYGPDDYSASAAEDRWIAERDRTASQ